MQAVGLVEEAGSEVAKYKVGDRVVIPDAFVLGNKEFIFGEGNLFGQDIGGCQGELIWQCLIQVSLTFTEAEFVCVPNADELLFFVPTGTDHELDYLTCSDIFSTSWGSITQSGFQPGDTVAVYGAGPVGLLAAYSALLRGAVRVYSIDHVDVGLARARSIGAIPIDLRKGDPSTHILKLEPNGVKRTSDCVGFECINPKGKKEEGYILNDAVKLTSTGGGIALTGVYWHGPRDRSEPNQGPKFAHVPFDIAAWWLKGIAINGGVIIAPSQEPTLLDLINAGRARPGFVFDLVVRIEDVPEGYCLFSEHKVQKVAIDFTGGTNVANGRIGLKEHTNGAEASSAQVPALGKRHTRKRSPSIAEADEHTRRRPKVN